MALIMGMNSGSSFDGIDVVLCETEMDADGFPKKPKYLCGGSYSWPEEVAKIVQAAFENKVDMVGLNRLNYECGAVFAEKAVQFMRDNKIDPMDITVLGLDTQTAVSYTHLDVYKRQLRNWRGLCAYAGPGTW